MAEPKDGIPHVQRRGGISGTDVLQLRGPHLNMSGRLCSTPVFGEQRITTGIPTMDRRKRHAAVGGRKETIRIKNSTHALSQDMSMLGRSFFLMGVPSCVQASGSESA